MLCRVDVYQRFGKWGKKEKKRISPSGGVGARRKKIGYGVATISRLLKIIGLFCKNPYKRDYILQKRSIILRRLLIVATPYGRFFFGLANRETSRIHSYSWYICMFLHYRNTHARIHTRTDTNTCTHKREHKHTNTHTHQTVITHTLCINTCILYM